ncbi:DUF2493 domain-containing protein (plasmid) [Azospirillum brasilense]|uniref:DUF2493 domain-containing protein n=1 Tax=Azospirillum brasilense TaxID=192 RepID=A0A4D8QUL9_AZOBR|nr:MULTISPECIES: DUF2493 domain-containing protein [Azospirillum]YP_001686861.1 DUF2493 domain-containing protein [Azospirillum phage Cd]MDW7555401.1 DUF2493 domain-containing protein [Azospirillum brasilense]MDW7595191.1 DUF2493 domain-containing protein [Azospirillum brasilense]MDW7630344.1 DUF2493 domain-containing protein [Azospirillum brasilense]MDX5949712.1 DUF2493 domain-containing protein [Azospirillum brasilense]OPH21605.1 hypothetical protein FE88_07975 [Azospirillum brasilense]
MTRVLVCGGRDYQDHKRVFAELDQIHAEREISVVIHGACIQRGMLSGADRWAEAWAIAREVPYWGFPARWNIDGGGKAGPMRNARMLEKAKPHIVVGFPGGRGTNGMLRMAREAGVMVIDAASQPNVTG